MIRLTFWLLVAFLSISGLCAAQQLTIAAAADLQGVLPEVSVQFQKKSGISSKISFGSSGNFFMQIENGAPFDVFFSADVDYPNRLEAKGLTERGSLHVYARGKIVLWTRQDSNLDLTQGMKVLLDPAIKKIAVANPEHAPYGRAAVAALKHENLYDELSGKFVLGENISQTASFVASGAADVGIIAMSLAKMPSLQQKGRYAEVPDSDYPSIEQAVVIVKSSTHKNSAQQLIGYLRTDQAKKLLQQYGFSIPAAK